MHTSGIEVIYKTVGEAQLTLHLFLPKQPSNQRKRAAIIFFHGGGFVQGRPAQFFPHCQHFADRGLVATTAHYRLLGKGADTVGDCLTDAKAAIRWLRAHADELQLDTTKIVAGGGSGGATLAVDAALIDGFDAPDDDRTISARANALVLFTPALFEPAFVPGRFDEQFYPVNHIRSRLPPMLILAGADDSHFPLTAMEQFRDAMVAAGNRCDLEVFPGEHGFFNYGRDENRPYQATLESAERFLAGLGMLACRDSSL